MNLTETPDFITWPPTHYAFVEKVGSFLETAPAAWGKVHPEIEQIAKNNTITGYMALYKLVPEPTYRAGVALSAPGTELPEGLDCVLFPGGKYARFVLTGAYSNLPAACGRVQERVEEVGLQVRPDFRIENYLNDPRTTPEEALVTEILVPVV